MTPMTHEPQEPSQTHTKPTRVNLLFHGLLAFVEKGGYYWVLIPDSPMHDFKIGDPERDPHHPYDALDHLPRGIFLLEGVESCAGFSCPPPPSHSIVLRGTMLEVHPHLARTVLIIPKPDVMRGFRAVESRTFDVATGDPTHRALSIRPDVVHTVVMVSYQKACSSHVRFVRVANLEGASVPPEDAKTIAIHSRPIANIGIYANAKPSELAMILKMTPDQLSGHTRKHDQPFNAMFQVKSPTGAHSPLNLTATVVGSKSSAGLTESVTDGPPTSTPSTVGVTELELLTLNELFHLQECLHEQKEKGEPHESHRLVLLNFGDPSGCTPVQVLET